MGMTAKPGRYGIEDALKLSWLKPAYWKTLHRLAAAHPEVAADGGVLRFTRYPFEPASVFPTGEVRPDTIAEVNAGHPSHIRLKSGEVLFVPRSGKAALLDFVNRHDVRVERRTSIWGALLDPFLDTWEEQKTIDAQFEWLAGLGLERARVDALRREVAAAMMAYNFGTNLWEWTGFDLYDVLIAQRACLSPAAFADFYARAMRVAALDQPMTWKPWGGRKIADEIHSVLLDWYPREKGSMKDFDERQKRRHDGIDKLRHRLAAELTAAYSEPHRRYHTVAHIEHCLDEAAGTLSYAVDLNEVRWALLFHDAVYDPRRQDNEARSADWACSIMAELGRPADEKERIRAMILATAHSGEPRAADEALVLDIDLAILGADEAAFDEYDRAVREEYAWVPEAVYRRERAKILESFLGRARLYHTVPYRARFERAARGNIGRALERLRIG
jgi:predicted metal-dependent HD superfamily phosphohydrolase